MCGLLAGWSKSGVLDERATLESALTSLSHRGPDFTSSLAFDNLWLGHTRLKIQDTHDRANQPLCSSCGRYSLIYNGEIYNFRQLRAELLALGADFQTTSDTEVILQAYAHWGKDCVQRFRGMWAFCLYDADAQQLFVSRDRFGIKPLYYTEAEGKFYVASEIKPLLQVTQRATPNQARVAEFLIYGHAEDRAGTFFESICKLPAGHNLVYDLRCGTQTIKQYYHLQPIALADDSLSLQEQCDSLLSSSVEDHLVSDVPIAVCLSGGMDSSTLAAMASSRLKERMTVFTVCSEDKCNDESAYAQAVVDRYQLNWVRLTPSYADFNEQLSSIVAAQEEPFGSPSIAMQYFLMQQVHQQGFKVLLDGQGADELFLGYQRYAALALFNGIKRFEWFGLPKSLRQLRRYNETLTTKLLAHYTLGSLFPGLRARFMNRQHDYLKAAYLRVPSCIKDYSRALKQSSFTLQKLEVEETSLPVLLRYADKNSMNFSVENRVPFLDHRLVEFCLSLPQQYKLRGGWTKWILRQVMGDRLPNEIAWRRNKIGFEAPEALWLRDHRKQMISAVSDSLLLSELTRDNRLQQKLLGINSRDLWRLYCVALWEQIF